MPPAAAPLTREALDGRWARDGLMIRLRSILPLLAAWSRKEYSVRYRQSLLGVAWSVVQPLALLAIFGTILTRVLHVSSGGAPYISFAYAGLVPWTFVASVLQITTVAMLTAGPVITKVYFPREVIPLAQVLAFTMDLAIGSCILLVILLVQGVGLSWKLAATPVAFCVLIVWMSAAAIFLSTVTVFIRDLRFAMPLFVQLLFFGSPIMYPAQLLPPSVAWVNTVNPIAVVVTSVRATAIRHAWPAWTPLLLQGIAAACALALALAYLRSLEPRLVDVL